MMNIINGMIRITKIPESEAPYWVRMAWLRAVLPVVGVDDTGFKGALSRRPKKGVLCYVVPQDEAIKILSAKSPLGCLAAKYWLEHCGFPRAGLHFGFRTDEAELIGTPTETRFQIRQFVGLEEVGVGAHDHEINQTE